MPKHPKQPKQRTVRIPGREIKTIGGETAFWSDIYHRAMTASLAALLLSAVAIYLGGNLFFAGLYWLGDGSVANVAEPRFLNLFFFAIEAFTTVGFGEMHPANSWGHSVYTLQGFVALIETAALTGLIFARFSRPRARIVFAANPVIAKHDGKTHLMLRIANARHNFVADASAQLWLTRIEYSKEGQRFRRFHELKLGRQQNPAFVLSWTLFHVIDTTSKLHGLSAEDYAKADFQFIVTLRGIDESSAQELHDRKLYSHEQVLWGRRYSDILTTDESGLVTLDYRQFNESVAE
jgi:inward rectifier potassium channel